MAVIVGVILGLAVTALVLIVWAPWRRVRAEGPLPPDVEARLLLGERADTIERDAGTPAPPRPPAPRLRRAR